MPSSLILVLLIACLCGASFSNDVIQQVSFYARAPLVLLLVLSISDSAFSRGGMARRRRRVRRSAKDPKEQWFVGTYKTGLTLLLLTSLASTLWSFSPRYTALQAAFFGLVVILMLSLLKRRWLEPRQVVADLRCTFLVLASTCAASLVVGTRVSDRLAGVYQNPNALGLTAGLATVLGVALWTVAKSGRAVLLIGSLVCLAAALASQSRTAAIATLLGCAWIVLSDEQRMRRIGKVALAGLLLAPLALAYRDDLPEVRVLDRFESEGSDPQGVLNGRQAGWDFARSIWATHPILGVGYRAGSMAFARYRGNVSNFEFDGAHSSYWQLLLELGIVGALFASTCVVAVLVAFAQGRHNACVSRFSAVVVAALATGYSESALVGSGQAISWIFWLSCTAVVALSAACMRGDLSEERN